MLSNFFRQTIDISSTNQQICSPLGNPHLFPTITRFSAKSDYDLTALISTSITRKRITTTTVAAHCSDLNRDHRYNPRHNSAYCLSHGPADETDLELYLKLQSRSISGILRRSPSNLHPCPRISFGPFPH